MDNTLFQTKEKQRGEWFQEWFDSPYYHLLYRNRDEAEARDFIDRLLMALDPPPGAIMLDLACGKGRYSRYLAEKGYCVTGLDISQENISYAQQFENERLSFFQHDKRLPFRINYFDYVFNFFTSFGYFETEKDHLKTLLNIAKGLRPDGKVVLDFFNTEKVARNLRHYEVKRVGDVTFHIYRRMDAQGYILKNIRFRDRGRQYEFTERVRAFKRADFERMFNKVGLGIERVYGDYHLNPYQERDSDRLVLVGKKGVS